MVPRGARDVGGMVGWRVGLLGCRRSPSVYQDGLSREYKSRGCTINPVGLKNVTVRMKRPGNGRRAVLADRSRS